MTDTLGYIGVVLPDGYKIQKDPRGRDVLVMKIEQADYIAGLMESGVRNKRTEAWEASSLGAEPEELGDGVKAWRPVPGDQDIVVWTKPGANVMIQNVEPGDLAPFDAYELSLALKEAANYASRPAEPGGGRG